jgi:hypothetical protein
MHNHAAIENIPVLRLMVSSYDETSPLLAFQEWVRKTLVPLVNPAS